MIEQHEFFMQKALEMAQQAFDDDEVPIGAILVKDGKIVAYGRNRMQKTNNRLAHAEMEVLNAVNEKMLYDYTLYVTVEPCVMCAGAIVWARVGKVVFGCYDFKAGAVGSVYNVLKDKSFNHHPKIITGILEDECKQIMQDFFRNKRKAN